MDILLSLLSAIEAVGNHIKAIQLEDKLINIDAALSYKLSAEYNSGF